MDRGYITKWDLEHTIWARLFGRNVYDVTCKEATIFVSEPLMNPQTMRKSMDEMVFEKFGFQAYGRTLAAPMALIGAKQTGTTIGTGTNKSAAVVVDSGFSFTHAVPVFKNRALEDCSKRLNVGGRLLTNVLKDTISARHWNMMEETFLVNDIKEKLCYVSLDYLSDLAVTKKKKLGANQNYIMKDYVMPNHSTTFVGHVKDSEEKDSKKKDGGSMEYNTVLSMNNERISIPEILFNPLDIGLPQGGIPEVIVQTINQCPAYLQGPMYSNILLVGGNTKFAGYKERIQQELRALAPAEFPVNVQVATDPTTCTWSGMSAVASKPNFTSEYCVSKKEWEEFGDSAWNRLAANVLQ